MPPTTRSRPQPSGITRKAPARKPRTTRSSKQPSDSWEVLAHEDNDDDDDDGNDDSTRTDTHHSRTGPRPETSDPRDAMHDLREMAERVGREVEDFAENLDKFLEELPTRNQSDAVLKLVDEFKAIASDAAYRMELDHRKERASLLRKEWSDRAAISTADGGMMAKGVLATSASLRFGGSLSGSRRELVELQRKWQQEADIWDLFRIMLELHYSDREVRRREVEAKLAGMGSVHRYTSEKELWDRFLLTDDLARERNLVKKWLEQTVDHQESDLAGIVEELESKSAGRGRGLWGHGWMHTREMIKHEKRLRNWPEPDAEPLPQLKRSDNPDPLITSLDPDAVTRQNRTLEKADSYFERATWIACWEMLRRGTSWEDVSEWCRERNEGWRAISIGKGADPSEVPSLSAWRKMCYLASQSGGCSDYEAAVYGLLGGNINAMQKVCRTLDDRLYANYSGYLVRKFDQYLSSTFPDRAPLARRGATEETLQDPEQAMYDLLSRLRKEPTTGAEAVKPLKIIQSYLIANDVGSMIHTLGHAISFTDQQRNQGERSVIARLQPFWRDGSQNQPEEEIALDTQALRIATHMSILLDTLSPPNLRDLELHAAENVTIAYIQTLRAAGKRDLIPVYASRLSQGAYVSAMGHVMQDITNEKEQGDMLSLLKQYNLNVVLILNTQLGLVLDACLANDVKQDEKPLNIVEGSHEGYHPSQRVRQGFVPQSPSEEDVSIVASLRWYNILEGQWEHAFGSLALALRKALIAGRLKCALCITHEFRYDNISTRKAYQVMGKSINPMEMDSAPAPDEAGAWDILRAQGRTYYELELLVNAIRALSEWSEQEAEYTQKHPKLSGASPALKQAKAAVDDAMQPVLKGCILLNPLNEDEAADLEQIRRRYIPELVLGYNAVLHASGYLISRENLLDSMEMSVTIADDTYHLVEPFRAAGRMGELVRSFAHTSKSMLVLKAEGRKWTTKKSRTGRDLGVWEIGSQSAGGGHARELSLS